MARSRGSVEHTPSIVTSGPSLRPVRAEAFPSLHSPRVALSLSQTGTLRLSGDAGRAHVGRDRVRARRDGAQARPGRLQPRPHLLRTLRPRLKDAGVFFLRTKRLIFSVCAAQNDLLQQERKKNRWHGFAKRRDAYPLATPPLPIPRPTTGATTTTWRWSKTRSTDSAAGGALIGPRPSISIRRKASERTPKGFASCQRTSGAWSNARRRDSLLAPTRRARAHVRTRLSDDDERRAQVRRRRARIRARIV